MGEVYDITNIGMVYTTPPHFVVL